jgi:hypothetical protein
MSTDDSDFNIADVINKIGDDIDKTLEECQKDKYFEQVVLIYSLIENILKWLAFIKVMWNKSDRSASADEVNSVGNYCKDLSFFNAQQTALALDIIDMRLYKRIDNARKERNNVIHQFWLYEHRGNRLVLRKKLEKLAHIASEIIECMNVLVEEIGVDEVLSIKL